MSETPSPYDPTELANLDNPLIRRLQTISNAFVTISSELDLDRVLQRIADTAREVAQARYAALGVVDEAGVIISFITSGLSTEEREKIGDLPRGHGLLGVLIKQGQPLRVPKISDDPRSCGFPPNHPPMDSLLGVPVSLKDRIVGDLYMTDKQGATEFTAEDQWWLTLFARQAAVAIENADLYQRARMAQERAQTLAELTSQLNRSIKPAELFVQITQATRQLLQLPASALYLLNAQRNYFKFETQFGMQLDQDKELGLPLQGSIAGRVLVNNRSVVIADTNQLSQIFFLHLDTGQLPGAMLVVPIRQNGIITGVLEAYADRPRQFSLEEIALLEAFADQAALALEKAQLYQQKEEFLSMTSHDLRAPLTAIKLSAGLLEANLPANLPPALRQLATNINRNSERLDNLIRDLLDLTRLEQGSLQLKPNQLELGKLVNTTLETLAPLYNEKKQALQFHQPEQAYWIEADRHRLEQALVNLLVNANKYTPAGGQVKVSLEAASDQQAVKVLIEDSGPGIPLEEQSQIFDRYYRRSLHEQNAETTGSGLGLPIARWLIELHGGQLNVESDPTSQPGSCFVIQLPLVKS